MLARIQSGTYTHMCAYGIFIFYINLFINKLIYIYNINKMSISLKNDLHELEQIKNAIKTNFLALKKLREKKKSIELKLIEYLEKNKNINGLKYNNIIISIQKTEHRVKKKNNEKKADLSNILKLHNINHSSKLLSDISDIQRGTKKEKSILKFSSE